MADFQDELQTLINRYSIENASDTPDFILAAYLEDCLTAFNTAVRNRETWYGRNEKVPESFVAAHGKSVTIDPPENSNDN